MNTFIKGKTGERFAEDYLVGMGYSLIARNFRAYPGEIDLVMTDGSDLVFVEVKAWKTLPFEELEYSVNKAKQQRIVDTSQAFMSQNQDLCTGKNIRYDVVYIGGDGEIIHLKDAIVEY